MKQTLLSKHFNHHYKCMSNGFCYGLEKLSNWLHNWHSIEASYGWNSISESRFQAKYVSVYPSPVLQQHAAVVLELINGGAAQRKPLLMAIHCDSFEPLQCFHWTVLEWMGICQMFTGKIVVPVILQMSTVPHHLGKHYNHTLTDRTNTRLKFLWNTPASLLNTCSGNSDKYMSLWEQSVQTGTDNTMWW